MIRTAWACVWLALLAIPATGQSPRQARPDPAPAEGSLAPDFTLHRLTAEGLASKDQVHLAKVAAERPVALVFGSYT